MNGLCDIVGPLFVLLYLDDFTITICILNSSANSDNSKSDLQPPLLLAMYLTGVMLTVTLAMHEAQNVASLP